MAIHDMTVSYDTMSPRGDKIEIKKKKKYSWSADNKLITWLVIFHLEVYLRSQRKLDTQMHFLLRKKKTLILQYGYFLQ